MGPRERVDIALVADNPGDWMFHCHILEHMEGGMMAVIRVA
jgi:FtsP/CotA-like multicopper oxidase with cupredoxin domain